MGAIRLAAHTRAEQPPKRRTPFLALLLAGATIAGAAAATVLWKDTHVAMNARGSVAVTIPDAKHAKTPSASDVKAIAAQASFPVVLPAGLPAGTTLKWIYYNPSTIVFQYDLPGAWRRSDHLMWIVLSDLQAANASHDARPSDDRWTVLFGAEKHRPLVRVQPQRWIAGGEVVILPPSTITPQELTTIQRAMQARSQRL